MKKQTPDLLSQLPLLILSMVLFVLGAIILTTIFTFEWDEGPRGLHQKLLLLGFGLMGMCISGAAFTEARGLRIAVNVFLLLALPAMAIGAYAFIRLA